MKDVVKIIKTQATPEQALKGLEILYDAYKENHRITQEEQTKRKEIEAQEKIELARIETHKEILKEYFERTFSEREKNFKEFFKRLDEGIASNNSELIQGSLAAILELAKESPLKQLQQIKQDFHNPDVDEIEF
jgi:septin family protein